jgi:hypothetical protein
MNSPVLSDLNASGCKTANACLVPMAPTAMLPTALVALRSLSVNQEPLWRSLVHPPTMSFAKHVRLAPRLVTYPLLFRSIWVDVTSIRIWTNCPLRLVTAVLLVVSFPRVHSETAPRLSVPLAPLTTMTLLPHHARLVTLPKTCTNQLQVKESAWYLNLAVLASAKSSLCLQTVTEYAHPATRASSKLRLGLMRVLPGACVRWVPKPPTPQMPLPTVTARLVQ